MKTLNEELEDVLQTEKALEWVRNLKTHGYSESWKGGYEKAYEEVKNSTQSLKNLIQQRDVDLEKAYGGCHKCYGKGYSTVIEGTEVMNHNYHYHTVRPYKQVKYCSCDRGKQLAELTKGSK